MKPDTEIVKRWIDENIPALTVPLPDDVLDAIARKAHAERWHPDAVGEAIKACAAETVDALDSPTH